MKPIILFKRVLLRKRTLTGMRLGTNYPYGPFEWCEKIGLNEVYETLEAIYEDTKDERYKICPLLKMNILKLNYSTVTDLAKFGLINITIISHNPRDKTRVVTELLQLEALKIREH